MAGLELRGISKRFGPVVANDDVDLTVARGEIHGLLGENGAGKTTLMNILFGLVEKDSGEISVGGQRVEIRSPFDASAHGIGMVHQHFQLVPNMSVAENLALLRMNRWLANDIADISVRISSLSERFGFGIDPSDMIGNLSVGQQQRVEILKLLYADTQVMVLDEPTAVLAPEEWDGFADLLRQLAQEGRSIVFISHKMKEQFDLSDTCTVLRRGKVIGTVSMDTATEDEIVHMMVGQPLEAKSARVPPKPDAKVVLKATGLSASSPAGRTLLEDVGLQVRAGETLGIAGVDGNGQEELVAALIGLLPLDAGSVALNGHDTKGRPPAHWRGERGALITANRHSTGVALDLSAAENLLITTAHSQNLLNFGFFKSHETAEFVGERLRAFGVQGGAATLSLRGLSGGNQQKLVLARELGQKAIVAIAAQPTRGLDIAAAQAVHHYLTDHKKNGGATVLISTEIDELLELSDRIAVMFRGRITGVLINDESFDFDKLAHMMAGEALQ